MITDWLTSLRAARESGEALLLPEQPLMGTGRALALAPHPDDPDAIGVILRLLMQGGWDLHWAILTPSWSGVEDAFVGADPVAKAQAREAEERAAARYFGLPDDHLAFWRLAEDPMGDLLDDDVTRRQFNAHLDRLAPDLVLCPFAGDTNPTHRMTYAWFAEWARAGGRPVIGLHNEDPKSQGFTPQLVIRFGETTAAWKAELLECHRSQSLRNQRTRGHTFADRILAVNRAGQPAGWYTERFVLEEYGPA